MSKNVNKVFFNTLHAILTRGLNSQPRGLPTRELLGVQTVVDMSRPVLTVPKRELGYKFLCAEAAWIMSGDNRVSTIEKFSPVIKRFSDNGYNYFGSYGPKVVDQVAYVVDCLARDQWSRQAYMNIWREQPRVTKDVPCTVGLQWMIRDGVLHCFDTMRSSDVWLGWPYDVFNMSMISLGICVLMREVHGVELGLGDLTLTAASQHIYGDTISKGKSVMTSKLEYTDGEPFSPKNFRSWEDVVVKLKTVSLLEDKGLVLKCLHKGLNFNIEELTDG